MTFDETTLRKIYETPPVGDTFPYDGGSQGDVTSHIKETTAYLNRSAIIHAVADYSSYGSGYASYVPVFCYKRDKGSSKQSDKEEEVQGIVYYLSRHAPLFIFDGIKASPMRWIYSPSPDRSQIPEDDWYVAHGEVLGKLRERGYSLADNALLDQRLPFRTKIDTVFNDPPYTIFDLLFHWED